MRIGVICVLPVFVSAIQVFSVVVRGYSELLANLTVVEFVPIERCLVVHPL